MAPLQPKMVKELILEIKWIAFVILHKFRKQIFMLKRLLVKPKLPANRDGEILIHLGCGDINSPEFINVDTHSAPHIHYLCDVTKLQSVFPDNYADLIYSCHVLEHIPVSEVKKTLYEWKGILKPHGILRLSVPDFDKLILVYNFSNKEIESINGPLMGYDVGYGNHRGVFNRKYLTKLLIEVGFGEVVEWEPNGVAYHNFDDWASMPIDRYGKQFNISLNLEAKKV